MNPVFTLENAIKHLEHSPPLDRGQALHNAFDILRDAYQALRDEHLQERPDFTPEWMKQYERNAILSNPRYH